MALSSKKSAPSIPTKIDVTSNVEKGRTVSILGGFIELSYYESILQDSIKVSYFYADAGSSIDGKSVVEGLPMIGTEDVQLVIEDNNQSKIKVDLNVNSINPVYEDSTKSITSLSLVSEQFIRNEEGSARIMERYDGNISENVKRILKDKLKAKSGKKLKEKNIEDTANDYNFFGNGRKPYYMLNYLSKASIPKGGENTSAGFLFFETSEGYHFKSIDALFSQKQKKSFIYNESSDKSGIPAGYDGKILEHASNNAVNAQSKMEMGTYRTKLVLFDPFNCEYRVIEDEAMEEKNVAGKKAVKPKGIKIAGKELPRLNEKFDNKYTRTTYMLVDSGSLPTGKYQPGSEGENDDQVKKNKERNFKAAEILNQAVRRYNQIFSGMMEITIAGDFSLHAGDVIFVDIPPVKDKVDDTVNKQSGGLYIIADLCHYITTEGTWTKLNLARDSFGRKGNHSTR